MITSALKWLYFGPALRVSVVKNDLLSMALPWRESALSRGFILITSTYLTNKRVSI
jgi:hypothetical protein